MILSNVLLLMALVIPGVILGKSGRIEEHAGKTMGNLLTDVAMPFLVLSNLLALNLSSLRPIAVIGSLLFPIITVFALFAITVLLFPKQKKNFSVSRFCSIFPNCGFMGLPLANLMFPTRPEIAVYISLFNISSTFLLLTFGVRILSEGSEKLSLKRIFLRPITVAVVLGFLLLALRANIPYLSDYCTLLAQLTTPLSMIVLGYELSKMPWRRLICTPCAYLSSAVKLVASPLITLVVLLLARLIWKEAVSSDVVVALFLATAVPTAASAPAMAKQYGLDGEHGAILTLGNSLLSIVTLPFLYLLFDWIFHF